MLIGYIFKCDRCGEGGTSDLTGDQLPEGWSDKAHAASHICSICVGVYDELENTRLLAIRRFWANTIEEEYDV